MEINYDGKRFRPIMNTPNGEVGIELVFDYRQTGNILSCDYESEEISKGQILGIVSPNGEIDMRYQHINKQGVLMTGICRSIPEPCIDGSIKLHEEWQWTSGDRSKGSSILVEVIA